jgi:hypothetical protein
MTILQKIIGATVPSFLFLLLLCISFPAVAFAATYIQDSFTGADGGGGFSSASTNAPVTTATLSPTPSTTPSPVTQTLLPTETTGSLGTVTRAQGGLNLWQAPNDNGISGSSAEDFLTAYTAPIPPPAPTPSPTTGNCGMQLGGAPAFCETFDAPSGIGNRSGQLNGTIWGISRGTGDMNFGADWAVPWVKATLDGCNGSQPAQPDETDLIICNGQLREATNDNATGAFEAGTVTVLAMYPKQPFDFAGRTGTVSFDVSNDTQGTHGAWPEFWLTDKPIPTPSTHFDNVGGKIPVDGFGIRFAAAVTPGQGAQLGPNCPNDNKGRWTVDSAIAIRNSVTDDTAGYGTRSKMTVTTTGCVTKSSGPNGGLNHVELRISQNQIDV